MARKKPVVEVQHTIHDAIRAYWSTFELHERIDRKRPMGIFANYLEPYFGSTPLKAITVEMVEEYLLARKREGAAIGTLWREFRLFKCLINISASREWVSVNKFRYVRLPKEKNRERVATLEELNAIRSTVSSDLWDVCCLGLHTGLRLSAILGLKSSMVKGQWLQPPKSISTSKTNCPLIPLTSVALSIILRKTEGFNRWACSEAFGTAWRYGCKRVGIDDLRFHDIRHTFATWLQELGVGYEERMYLMGHSMGGTTKHYSHADPRVIQKLQEAISLLDSHRPLIEKAPKMVPKFGGTELVLIPRVV